MASSEKPQATSLIDQIRKWILAILAVVLAVFTVWEVNYATLPPMAQLAGFAMIGTVLCFIIFPIHKRLENVKWLRLVDFGLSLLIVACCTYLIIGGTELTNRQGKFTPLEQWIGIVGTVLIFEATRRAVGLALPILAGVFVIYALVGPSLPDWAFPHKGYDVYRIAETCFLGTSGVFGIAMNVMFTYVFLFVVFGVFLEASGATQFIIDFARRVFGGFSGGPAMVSVAGAGLMGSLSGSAVANAATTGSFTIPMMTSAGFKPKDAGGIMAAAASGGALMPPVMGAGAYMMLEIIDPPVTFLQIVKAALIPALLYYLSLLLIVYFFSRRIGTRKFESDKQEKPRLLQFSGLVFFAALGSLILFLLMGRTPFRAVSWSLEIILLLTVVSPKIDVSRASRNGALAVFALATIGFAIYRGQVVGVNLADWTAWADAGIAAMLVTLVVGLAHPIWRTMLRQTFEKAARGGIALVAASGCVGVIIGIVGMTGVGTEFPNAVVPLAEESLLAALIAIMICSIILGMGLPSAVCYLLMATLIGPVLSQLGVVPLAAHLFIFYFGMMSMVTPPVALAAYASASIAKSKIMPTAVASFFFALVGFTLPFMFVFRPELLMLTDRPDLKVAATALAGDNKVKTELEITFIERPVTNSRVIFAPTRGGAEIVARTDVKGIVSADLTAGDWSVAVVQKRREGFQLKHDGIAVADAGKMRREISRVDAKHWLETRDGKRITGDFVPRTFADKNREISLKKLLDLSPGKKAETGNAASSSSESVILKLDAVRGDVGEDSLYDVWDGFRVMHLGTLSVNPAEVKHAPKDLENPVGVAFDDQRLTVVNVLLAIGAAVLGIIALAAGIAGFFIARLSPLTRCLMFVAAALLFLPQIEFARRDIGPYVNIAGAALFLAMAVFNGVVEKRRTTEADDQEDS